MNRTETPNRTVKSAETTFAILESLKEHGGMRLSELADDLDIANSTLHRYLQTLLGLRYLVREGDTYHVGLRFLDLGEQARNRKRGYRMARQKVIELAEETQERAQFIVEEHGQAVYVHREAGSHAVQTDPGIGKRTSIYAASAGKAIMAEWPEEKLSEFLSEQELSGLTSNTITDADDLRAELEAIRNRGYAVNRGENIDGLRALGVSICDPEGVPIGALSVSGPTSRMQSMEKNDELPEMLMGFKNELELNLRYS